MTQTHKDTHTHKDKHTQTYTSAATRIRDPLWQQCLRRADRHQARESIASTDFNGSRMFKNHTAIGCNRMQLDAIGCSHKSQARSLGGRRQNFHWLRALQSNPSKCDRGRYRTQTDVIDNQSQDTILAIQLVEDGNKTLTVTRAAILVLSKRNVQPCAKDENNTGPHN
jgi:hypothetical protein